MYHPTRRLLVPALLALLSFSLPHVGRAASTAVGTPPTVTLISPTNGASAVAPATFTATAVARDADGAIVRVHFLVDGRPYGVDTTAPYSSAFTLPGGSYTISAVATDSSGAATTSRPATVTVRAPSPTITSLASTRLIRSGLLRIRGTNFGGLGTPPSGAYVDLGGVRALISRWHDTEITAYVPESAPLGPIQARIVSNGSTSNAVAATITTRPAASGRIRWRFTLDAMYAAHRSALGPDGTVYTVDSGGSLYALRPDGALKWIFRAGLGGTAGTLAVGADGTIYVAGLVFAPNASTINVDAIFAVNPDGTQRWVFAKTGGTIMAGPSLGPDGNIYAVAEQPGIGLFSLTPTGTRRFAVGSFLEQGVHGAEIVFGAPGQLYFGALTYLYGYSLDGALRFRVDISDSTTQHQPAVGPNGDVYAHRFPSNIGRSLGAFRPTGQLRWSFYEFPGNVQGHPDVGADGTIYMVRNLSTLLAFNTNGSVKWRLAGSDVLDSGIVSPRDDLILIGGVIGYGQAGFFQAVSTRGAVLWRVPLPVEPGFGDYGQVRPMSRPRFTPDGQTAYISADVAGNTGPSAYSYLYAVNTASPTLSAIAVAPATVLGGSVARGTISLAAPAPAGGLDVALSTTNRVAHIPTSVWVAPGASTARFSITTTAVSELKSGEITATLNGVTAHAPLAVRPIGVKSVIFAANPVSGPSAVQGTVTLEYPAAPGDITVTLASGSPHVAWPTVATLTIPLGTQHATFVIKTADVTTVSAATIRATVNDVSRSQRLTVNP